MTKITLSELFNRFYKFNEENNVTHQFEGPSLTGCIVFKPSNWPDKDYSLESRTYIFSSNNKHFISGMGGNSIFASNLDHTDECVRLDHYLGEWEIDYCYIEESKTK